MLALLLCAVQDPKPEAVPVVLVDRDDVIVDKSCVLEMSAPFVRDANGDGVVHVVADGVAVAMSKTIFAGAAPGTPPDQLTGTAISVRAKNVAIRGGFITGYKAGIVARGADGLVVEGVSFGDMFRQRLKSTPQAEDQSDWLWPHENDGDEWLANYGAAIYVAESQGVTLRLNSARAGQNGICLRRVDESKVYDNDMSFLSGWGLALYRSSKNVVSRNSFDFCIRGYSHGRYARGQDSAGILCFEQSSDNVFAFNSATHGGDGFFGYAGNEALDGPLSDHKGVGCNRNLLYGNDFSYAAAIGIEMTFSFGNVFALNRLVGANYGVWGGYSSSGWLRWNVIADSAISGVAIEHGSGWQLEHNEFANNARAVELWWDDDKDLLAKPWAAANATGASDFLLANNSFDGGGVQLELRGGVKRVIVDTNQRGIDKSRWQIDQDSSVTENAMDREIVNYRPPETPGKRVAVGALKALEGRDKIVMTEWGPYDWKAPYLQRVDDFDGTHRWRLLGEEVPIGVDAGVEVRTKLDMSSNPPVITVSPRKPGRATPYELVVQVPSKTPLSGKAVLLDCEWTIGVFAWTADPREKLDEWHAEAKRAVTFTRRDLSLAYQSAGPSELAGVPKEIADAKLSKDRFGTLARAEIELPAGRWRLTTRSDDGVRVWIDDALMIDNWTWHAPTKDVTSFDVDGTRATKIRVEHFELDGFALLELSLEKAD